MTNGYLKLFGNITESEFNAVREQYNEQCKKVSDFQKREYAPQNDYNGYKRAPKIKGAKYTRY